jgi:hypothetical protein
MDKNIQLFKAAYYANLEDLKKLIKAKGDLIIHIPTPGGSYNLYWQNGKVVVSLLEILNWSNYAYFDCFERDILSYKLLNKENECTYSVSFNPSIFYRKVINCIEWICHEFKIFDNYILKNYSKYRALRHLLMWMITGWMRMK